MGKLLALVAKDLRLRFSGRTELLFYIILPVLFISVLTGFGAAGNEGANAAGSAGFGGSSGPALVLFHDGAGNPASRAFAAALDRAAASESPRRFTFRAAALKSDILREGGARALVDVEGAADAPFAVSLLLSPWNSGGADFARDIGGFLEAVGAELAAAAPGPAAATTSAAATTGADAMESADTAVRPADAALGGAHTADQGAAQEAVNAFGNAGQVVTWALVPLFGLGGTLIAERLRPARRRLRTTGAGEGLAALASIVAAALASFVQVALMLGFGALAFGLPWFARPAELAAVALGLCAAGAAVGCLIGQLFATERQASSFAIALAMSLAATGGCWIPGEVLPASVRAFGAWQPAGMAMDGLLAALGRGGDAYDAALRLGLFALGAAGAALLLAAYRARPRRAILPA